MKTDPRLSSSALPAGPSAGPLGPAAPTHHPVLPDRRLGLHGPVQGVGLQAPLERRAGGAPAGGAHGSARGKKKIPLNRTSSGNTEKLSDESKKKKSGVFQVFFVSDFFKPGVDLSKKVDAPHSCLQETPTNGNHFESQLG